MPRVRQRRAVLFTLAPFVGACLSIPLWDRVRPTLLGLPFNLFWVTAWIPLTSLCLYLAYRQLSPPEEGP